MDRSDLYAVSLDEFTAQRNALAKELRGDGKHDEAAEVAKLRKPSAAAWAVNQLTRQAKQEMRALFKAGDALQRAQADLLSGKGEAEALRPAVDTERQAVDALADRAEDLLPGAGSRRQQIADTLHAAALDDDARALVQAGCLDRELQHVGLGGFGGLDASSPSPAPARARKPKPKHTRKDAERERKAAEEARAARQAEADARRAADRARRHLEVVQERRDGLAGQLKEIEDELKAAKRGAADADKALKRLSG